jgi:hypothetical protein
MTIEELPFPPHDGAPYYCNKEVKAPPPYFYTRCKNKSKHFYGHAIHRCDEHEGQLEQWEVDLINGNGDSQ